MLGEKIDGTAGVTKEGDRRSLSPPARVKFFYCFGQVVESSYISASSFIFFYYTAVLDLSGSYVGAAMAISLCIDAIADPLIGSWSDSVRSRFGRRLPVMLVGAPLTMLAMGLLFAPPAGLSPFLLFVWLTLAKAGVRGFASMFNIPFFALGGEMSDGFVDRSRIVSYRLLAGIFTSVLITALAYSVFFAGEGGLQRPERYPSFGWAVAAVLLVAALVCCAGVWRYAIKLPQPAGEPMAIGRRFAGEISELFRSKSFKILFISMLLFASAIGMYTALQNHIYVFVWKIRSEDIQILTYVYLGGVLLATVLTPRILRRHEKKTAVALGFLMVTAAWVVLPSVRAIGIFKPTGTEALHWLCWMNALVGLGTGIVFVAFPSMMADAADEHEYHYGVRREGLYFSGLGFAGKAAAGIGALIGGLTLDVLRFPHELGKQINPFVPESILSKLVLAWGVAPALFCALGAIVFGPYALSRVRYGQIADALRDRRGGPEGI